MKTHVLKTDGEPFEALWQLQKKAEFRKDDRGFEVGDSLALIEQAEGSTRVLYAKVTHVLRGPAYGIPEGYAMLSIEVVKGTGEKFLQTKENL